MNFPRAISYLYPSARWTMSDQSDYSTLVWIDAGQAPTLADLQAADLPAAKAQRVLAAKGEAHDRIMAQYPEYAQRSCALGLYDSLPTDDPFYPANMKAGIQAIINAEHQAEVDINALTSGADVDAFTW